MLPPPEWVLPLLPGLSKRRQPQRRPLSRNGGGKGTWVRNRREAAAPIGGRGRPPLAGTPSNDCKARRRWWWLAHVRGGERRRTVHQLMAYLATSLGNDHADEPTGIYG